MVSLIAALVLVSAQTAMEPNAPDNLDTSETSDLEFAWIRPGHIVGTSGIGLVSISPNGITMASGGGDDGTVKIWSLQDRKLLKTIVPRPRQMILSVDFSTDGAKLLVCGSAYTAILDAQEWKVLKQFPISSRFGGIFVDRSRAFMLGNPARIYDAETGNLVVPLTDALLKASRLPYSFPHVEPYIATSLFDKERRVFVAGTTGLQYFDNSVAHKEYVTYIDAITLESRGSYQWWSSGKFNTSRYGPGSWPNMNDMAYLPNGDLLIYGRTSKPPYDYLDLQTLDHTFSSVTQHPLIPMTSPPKNVCFGVCFSPLRDRFAIFMVDQRRTRVEPYVRLNLFDSASISPIGKEVYVPGTLRGLAVDGDGFIASNGELARYSSESSRPVPLTHVHSPVASLFFKGQSMPAAASLSNGAIIVWNPVDPDKCWTLIAPTIVQRDSDNRLMSPAKLTDITVWKGKLIGGAVGPYAMVLDATTGKELHRYVIDPDTGNTDRPIIRAYNGGAQILVATEQSKKDIRMLDTDSGKELRVYQPTRETKNLEVSDKYVVAVTDSKLRIWDTPTAKLLYEWPLGWMRKLAINDQLNVIAAADFNGNVASFDITTGKKVHDFVGALGPILAICLTKDNRMITLGDDSKDPTPLRVWDLATGKLIKKFAKEMAPFSSQYPLSNNLAYDDKSGVLAISRSDGTILGVKID